MIYENEIIMLVLSLGVLVFVLLNYFHLKRIPCFGALFAAFCLFGSGSVMTILEDFFSTGTFLNSGFNFLEHFFYASGGILLSAWCWRAFGRGKEGRWRAPS